jgi:hypothetical protein
MRRTRQRDSKGGIRGLVSGRTALTLVTVFVVLLAGCSGLTGGGDSGDGSAGTVSVDSIPEGVEGVMHFDSGIATDQTTESLYNGFINMAMEQNPNYDGPESYDEFLEQAEQESNLSTDGFQSMTVFYKYESANASQEYAGVIMNTDWTVEQMAEASDQSLDDLNTTEYQGTTVYIQADQYTGETSWLADVGDGTFIAGTEPVVKDVLDTRNGEMNAWSGELKDTYENSASGYMKVAMEMPPQEMSQGMQPAGGMVPSTNSIDRMSVVYHTSGNEMNMDAHMFMDSTQSADQLKATIDTAIQMQDGQMAEQYPELSSLLEGLSAERDGTEITVSFTTTPDEIISIVEMYANQMRGIAESQMSVSSGAVAG